jgi:DNA-binding XRE family transcriptional regulator
MRTTVQIIKNHGKPEWAVIPYEDYVRFEALDAISQDLATFKEQLAAGEEELLPEVYAKRLIQGENPIRVWRQYRELTQAVLAKKANISVPYLSQLERGERTASVVVLKRIARVLGVVLDDII